MAFQKIQWRKDDEVVCGVASHDLIRVSPVQKFPPTFSPCKSVESQWPWLSASFTHRRPSLIAGPCSSRGTLAAGGWPASVRGTDSLTRPGKPPPMRSVLLHCHVRCPRPPLPPTSAARDLRLLRRPRKALEKNPTCSKVAVTRSASVIGSSANGNALHISYTRTRRLPHRHLKGTRNIPEGPHSRISGSDTLSEPSPHRAIRKSLTNILRTLRAIFRF